MGKQLDSARTATKVADTEATRVAQSVSRDFADLITVFERELCNLSGSDDPARWHLAKAKAAAERGLELSQDLIAAMTR